MFCDGSIAASRAAASANASVFSGFRRFRSNIADVLFTADCRVIARFTAVDVVWRRWKAAGVDRVYGVDKPLLRVRKRLRSIRRCAEQADDAFRSLERQIRGF